MPWFKVDDQLDGNKKVRSIPRRNRTKAIGLWTLAGAFCARELTDGFVPDYMIPELWSTPKIADELVSVGMWERVENGYKFVHWSEFQPTSDEVKSKRQNESERKRRWREKALGQRSKAHEQEEQENVPLGQERLSQRPSARSPSVRPLYPTRPDPTLKKEGKKETGDVTAEASPTPSPSPLDAPSGGSRASLGFSAYGTLDDPRCAKHKDLPRDQVPACRDCAHARQVLQERHDHEKREARRLVDECPWCDERGIANLHDRMGRPVAVRCDHVRVPVAPPPPAPFQSLRSKK